MSGPSAGAAVAACSLVMPSTTPPPPAPRANPHSSASAAIAVAVGTPVRAARRRRSSGTVARGSLIPFVMPSIGDMVDAVGIHAVIFDLDGVLIDSEERWAQAKEALVRETGGRWKPEASHAMLGMSSPEWSRYLHEELGVPLAPEEINDAVVARMLEDYRRDLPLIEGARDAVLRLAARWRAGTCELVQPRGDRRGARRLRARRRLCRHRLLRGGRAGEARTRRLPRGGGAASVSHPATRRRWRTRPTGCWRRARPGWPSWPSRTARSRRATKRSRPPTSCSGPSPS